MVEAKGLVVVVPVAKGVTLDSPRGNEGLKTLEFMIIERSLQ